MIRKISKKQIWRGSTQLAPLPAVMAACGGNKGWKQNIITLAWTGIVCSDPPMLGISIRPERYSFEIIHDTGEFTLNIPTARLANLTDWCGVVSGRDHDKFQERNLTALPSSEISAPLIGECPLGLECRVKQEIPLGSHTLFLADILAVQVSESYLDDKGRLDLEKDGLLAYVHGHYFDLGRCIGHFGFSIRKKGGPKIRR
ncbi:MAG TPA: hypothetical protein DE060_12835 [Lentisphaeria bacterium]|jgi:flavin reductase (DIM6/NTAB) family NADH-FMN oxidoreductase RutF|nr:hypothetical protein [Lentisphaeria bacterium]HCG50075.1 hypothetical protein [Lentisphaeria bacterium]